jgi:lipoprotein-releasing system permease protein
MVWGNYSELIYAKHAAVLGTKLADYLELKPGDEFTLIRQNKSIKLRVAGLIETGTGSDETLAYLPLATAQEILGEPNIVSEVGLRLYDIYDAPSIAAAINRKTSYNAESWQQLNKDTLQVLDTQNLTLYLFYGLILIISGFGVANSMIVNVTRRTKDIGILLAMGTTRRSILKIFIIESLILGPPAALLGCALAYIIAIALNSFPIQIPSSDYNLVFRMEVLITYQNYLLAIIFALAVNLLSGIYPAYKASRLDPVEAIASE